MEDEFPKLLLLSAERFVPAVMRVCDRVAVVSRRTVTVRKLVEVDVSHEELVIEYEAGDGADLGPAPEKRDAFSVLLHAEDVVITKTVRVVEEVLVSTRTVADDPKRFEDELRREILAEPEFVPPL